MLFNKDYEFIYCNGKIRIGYSIGTVYNINPNDYYRFELYNVGYCKSIKEFYYNKNIHLSKELIEYFEDRYIPREQLEAEMQEIGIYDGSDVDAILKQYNDTKVQNELTKEKALNLKRALKTKKVK